MPWFQRLEASPTAETALAEYTPPAPGQFSLVPKGWTELAYEHVRRQVRPEAPSRLGCLFAMVDPLEALSFTEETGNGQAVFEGSVEAGVRWAVVDMAQYANQQPPTWSVDGLKEPWDRACEAAVRYWSAPGALTPEVLVSGAIHLLPQRLLLIPTLRRLGVVE